MRMTLALVLSAVFLLSGIFNVNSHIARAGSVLIYERAGTFPDGHPYRAFLGPNQGISQTTPDCAGICGYTALIYHSGWVQDTVHAYNLFWQPTGDYSGYDSWMSSYFTNSNGTSYRDTLTQYYQQLPSAPGPTYLTHNAYVYANQNDTYAYSNYSPNHPTWITDYNLTSELKRVGIGAGDSHDAQLNVFLPNGEQVCTDNNGTPVNCFPGAGGCGYHGSFQGNDGNTYAYSVIPFGAQNGCSVGGTYPNRVDTDTALTVLSHESFEVMTDPGANNTGWFGQTGDEIADKCAWQMGSLNYDGYKANHQLGSSYYLLQMEWSDHTMNDPNSGYCVQTGI